MMRILQATCVLLIVFGLDRFYKKELQGFSASNIFLCKQIEVPSYLGTKLSQEEIQILLSQPFYFLSSGHQCYVFLSKDQKTVMKLLQADKIKTPWWACCFPWTEKSIAQRHKRLTRQQRDFTSYQIALEKLPEESGILYVQLQESTLHGTMDLYDALGTRHSIPISSICFLLQEKAEPVYPLLSTLPKEELHFFLDRLWEILQKQHSLNIFDVDLNLKDNIGILKGRPLLFDVGTLSYQNTSYEEATRLILPWLELQAPEEALFFKKKIIQNF